MITQKNVKGMCPSSRLITEIGKYCKRYGLSMSEEPPEAGRRRPGRVGLAPSRLADEQAAAAAPSANRRRAASAPPERERATQQARVTPALSTLKAGNLQVRAAALKVHPIVLESEGPDSEYWRGRSAASRQLAASAFRTLGKVLIDVPSSCSDEEKKKALIEKGQHQASHGSLLSVVCELNHELKSSLPMRPLTKKSKRKHGVGM